MLNGRRKFIRSSKVAIIKQIPATASLQLVGCFDKNKHYCSCKQTTDYKSAVAGASFKYRTQF